MGNQDQTSVRAFFDLDPDTCPVRQVMHGIGNKWAILVLVALSMGSQRFGELRGLIPDVSQKMLTQVLRNLERDGLVSREDRGGFPRVVVYDLTEMGTTLQDPIRAMSAWSNANLGSIKAARRAYDDGEAPTEPT